MRQTGRARPIELTLPADPELMLVTRLTAAGVIARAGVTVDRMDELKMAVEEACGCLMEQENAPGRLRLRFEWDGDRLLICATALDAQAERGSLTREELDVMRCILSTLVDDAAFEVRDGWIAGVRMSASLTR